MALRSFLTVIILSCFFHAANCQIEPWTIRVSVTFVNNQECGWDSFSGRAYEGTNHSITYLGSSQTSSGYPLSYHGSASFSASFSDADGVINSSVSFTTSAKCKCINTNYCSSDNIKSVSGSVPLTHTPSNGNCRSVSQTVTVGNYSASVVVTYIKTMNLPSVNPTNGTCGDANITLSTTSTASASGYKWYVADELGSAFHEITGKTAQTITVNANDLNKTGFETIKRKFKVEDAGCAGTSASTSAYPIYSLPPSSVSLSWIDPRCFESDDGEVTINSVTGQVSNYLFTLQYFESTTSSWHTVYQKAFATSALPVTIRKADIIGQGIVAFGLKDGEWKMETANNSSVSTLGSCATSVNKVLIQPPKLNATLTGSNYNGKGVECNGDTNGSVSVSATGGTGAYTYLWTTGGTGTSITDRGAGTYSVTVTDAQGCTDTKSHTITEASALTVSIAKTKAASCAESSDGKLTATPAGGVSPYTYTWSNSQTNAIAVNLAKGTYTVTVKDVNNCETSNSEDPGAPAPIIVTLDATPPTCADGANGRVWVTNVANAPSSVTYLWNTGDDTFEISNLAEGTYSVIVSSDNGGVTCTGTASKAIVDPGAWTATISPTIAYNGAVIKCNGEANGRLDVTLKNDQNQTVIGEFYTWSNGTAGVSANYIDQLAEGTYSVTVRYKGICNATASLTISDPEPVIASVAVSSNYNGFHISCPGAADGKLHAVGGGGTGSVYTFVWNTGTPGPDLTGRTSGSYTVVATDVNGCTGSGVGSLNDPPTVVPEININSNYNGQAIKCRDGEDAKLQASATGGAGGYTYIWNNGVSGAILNGIGAGTYTVTVTDANSCSQSKSQILINPSEVVGSIAVISNFNGQAIKCHNELNGKIEASGTGGVSGYSYLWNTGFNGATLQNVGHGTYSVIVSDANGCNAQPVSQTLINPDPVIPTIDIISDYNGVAISCDGAQDGTLEASATGGTNAFAFSWNTGASGSILSGLSKGNYTVTAIDQNGCTGQVSKILDDPDPVFATIVTKSDYNGFGIHCIGDLDGYIEASGSGGTGAYSYVWQNTSETSYRISDIGEGTYTVIVSDVNGCSGDVSSDIISPSMISLATLEKTDPKCFSGSDGNIKLQAYGGVGNYAFVRDLLPWQMSSEFTGLSAGDYVFKTKDANGCVASLTESIGQPTQVKISFTDVEPAFCSDPRGKATAIVTGGSGINYTYEWKDAANIVFDTDTQIENLSAGVYKLTAHDENNCPAIGSVGIISTDGPVADIEKMIPARCSYSSDGSATLKITTGNSPYTFLWPDGQTNFEGKNLPRGSYIVTITDTYGCISTKEVEITAPDELSIILAETTMPSCHGLSDGKLRVEAVGGTPEYTFSWNGFSGAEVSGLAMGNHNVQVIDANGCTAFDTFPLNEPTPLEVNLIGKQLPSCSGYCDGAIEVQASGANGNYQYMWANQTTAKVTNICAGDHVVIVKDERGCMLEKTYNLGEPEVLQAKLLEITRPSCFEGCDGILKIEAFGGNGSYKYVWTEGTQSNVIQNICAGDHLVTITDAKGCELKDKVFSLDQPEAVQARIVNEQMPFCNADCNGSLQVEGYGGSGGYTYLWSTGKTSATVNDLCAGDYAVTIKDQKNCILADEIFTLHQPDPLKLSLSQMTPPTCTDGCDGALRVEASGGNGNYQYTWSTGTKGAFAQGLCVQEYSVIVSDEQGCLSTANYSVGNTPQLVIDLGAPLTICVGQKHQLDAGSQWEVYKWTANTGFTANTQQVTIDQAGLYQLEVINSNGCIAKDDFLLQTSTDLLNAEFFLSAKAVVGDTVVLVDVSWPLPEKITWQYPASMIKIFDSGPVVHGKFNDPGTYEIILSASLGECQDKMAKNITILKESEDEEGGRLGYEKFVTQFELYPNPNDGEFDVSIQFVEASDIMLSVWNTTTGRYMGKWRDEGKSYYRKHVNLRPLGSGTYVLRLDHARGAETIRFVVY